MISDELERAIEALKILLEFNRIRNDLDAYLFDIIQWGLGDIQDRPDKSDYGL